MQAVMTSSKVVIEERKIARDELAFEFMLGALRLKDGIPTQYFEERTGLLLLEIQTEINEAIEKGLLEKNPLNLQATPFGLQFLNDLQELFLPVVTDL